MVEVILFKLFWETSYLFICVRLNLNILMNLWHFPEPSSQICMKDIWTPNHLREYHWLASRTLSRWFVYRHKLFEKYFGVDHGSLMNFGGSVLLLQKTLKHTYKMHMYVLIVHELIKLKLHIMCKYINKLKEELHIYILSKVNNSIYIILTSFWCK